MAQHHWPTWGNENVVNLLKSQRDLYRYINDQTLRMANEGLTRDEIAANFKLPDSLANTWANRGYYGSVSHDVKATYVLYLGWFDGNPATLRFTSWHCHSSALFLRSFRYSPVSQSLATSAWSSRFWLSAPCPWLFGHTTCS